MIGQFIIKSLLFKQIKRYARWVLPWSVILLITTLFINDQLVSTSIRLFLFICLMGSGSVILISFLIQTIYEILNNQHQQHPLDVERLLLRYSKWSGKDIRSFLNRYFAGRDSIEFADGIPIRPLRKKEWAAIVFISIGLFALIVSFPSTQKGWHDLLFPLSPSAHLESLAFTLAPGHLRVENGDSLSIVVTLQNNPIPFSLKVSYDDGNIQSFPVENNLTTIPFEGVESSFSYQLISDFVSSETFNIDVIQRPFISKLTIKSQPPQYTGLPSGQFNLEAGNLFKVPEGTRVDVSFEFSNPDGHGTIFKWRPQPVSFSGPSFSFNDRLFKSRSFLLSYQDTDGLTNLDTTTFSIRILKDEPPFLGISSPTPDTRILNRDQTLPISLTAMDDYGIAWIKLKYRVHSVYTLYEPAWETIVLATNTTGKPNVQLDSLWKFPEFTVAAGDQIDVQLGTADHYPFQKGGHEVWSEIIRIQVPDVKAFAESSEAVADSIESKLTELSSKARVLKEKTESKRLDLVKKDGKLDFSEQTQMKELADEQQAFSEQVNDAQKKMDQMTKQLQENQTLSLETLEKYLELQQLLQTVKDPRLLQAMNQLEKDLNQLSRQEVAKALENMEINNEDILRQLDRSIEAIRKLQIEQSLEAIAQQTEDLVDQQQRIHAESLKEKPSFESIASQQELQTQRLEALKQQASTLENQLKTKQEKENQQPGLDSLLQRLKSNDLTQLSESVKQSASQKKQEETQKKSQQLSKDMQDLANQSRSAQQASQQNDNMQTLSALRDFLRTANRYSELILADRHSANQTTHIQLLTDALSPLESQLNNIARLEPQIGQILGRDLSQIKQLIDQSKKLILSRQVPMSKQTLETTYAQVNAMVYRMLTLMSMQNNQQGKGSGQQERDFLSEMQQLANQQRQLNQTVMDQQQLGQQQGLSKQRLMQLAAQQEKIRQQLNELMEQTKSSGNNTGLGTDMSTVEKEMEAAAKNLVNQIDAKLIERQQQILSRMLDAQRSTIEREFESKREAITNQVFFNPPATLLKTESTPIPIRQPASRSLNKLPDSYREIILDHLRTENK